MPTFAFERPLPGGSEGAETENFRTIALLYSKCRKFEDEYDGHIVFENDVRIFELMSEFLKLT